MEQTTTKKKGGYVKFHRATVNLKKFEGDGMAIAAWALLCAWTVHKPRFRDVKGVPVWLEQGQCPTTSRGLAKKLGCSRDVARRVLAKLVKLGLIKTEVRGDDCTVVTVIMLAAESAPTYAPTPTPTVAPTPLVAKAALVAGFVETEHDDTPTYTPTQTPADAPKLRDGITGDGITETASAREARAYAGVDPRDGQAARLIDIQRLSPPGTPPADLSSWTADVARVREKLEVTHDELGPVLMWALVDAADPFWRSRLGEPFDLLRHWPEMWKQWQRSRLKVVSGGGYGRDVGAHR